MHTELESDRREHSERFNVALREIKVSQADLARELGVDRRFVNDLVHRRKRMTPAVAKFLEARHGLSAAWLLHGEGQMLKLAVEDSSRPITYLPLLHEVVAGDPRECPSWRKTFLEVLSAHVKRSRPNSLFYVLEVADPNLHPELRRADLALIESVEVAPGEVENRLVVVEMKKGKRLGTVKRRKKGGQDKYVVDVPGLGEGEVAFEEDVDGVKIVGVYQGLIWRGPAGVPQDNTPQ